MKANNIRTIGQRQRLSHRPKPYWSRIDGLRGAALGFRKHAARGLQGGGAWVLRYRVEGTYQEHGFAEADNSRMPANGSTVLTFDQAIERARFLYSERTSADFIDQQAAEKKPYTVGDCCRDYVRDLERRRRRFQDASQRLEAFVIPVLGNIVLEALTAKEMREWMQALAERKPRARSPMSGRVRRYRKVDEQDDDYPRRRAATVNRIWTSFRAALNLSFQEDRLQSVQFQKVKPLKVGSVTVNRPHCRPILPEEMDAFLAAVALEGEEFQNLVLVGLYCGARYGELGRLRVGDYDQRHGTLYIRPGKTGHDRLVRVIPEGRTLIEQLTRGRKSEEAMLVNPDGEAWGKSHQTRPMDRVLSRYPLDGVSFKSTRDTFGTWLLNAGVRLVVVADQLGHRNIDITRKHYARIIGTLERESTTAAERIRFVGGAEIIELDVHRSSRAQNST